MSTAILGGALAFAGHQLADAFTHDADPHRERHWLLTEDNELLGPLTAEHLVGLHEGGPDVNGPRKSA